VSCLKVAFLGNVSSSLVLLVSAKTHYHQLSSCASYGMGHRELRYVTREKYITENVTEGYLIQLEQYLQTAFECPETFAR
ncbi:hypothetical protein P5673_011864, partial [Acropora cervicornis]